MRMILNFKPEVEAGLFAQAQANGLSVEDYVLGVIERSAAPASGTLLSAEERARLFDELAMVRHLAAPLSDYAISREAMYDDETP